MSRSLPYPYNDFITGILSEQTFAKTLMSFLQQHPSKREEAANYLEMLVNQHGLSSEVAQNLLKHHTEATATILSNHSEAYPQSGLNHDELTQLASDSLPAFSASQEIQRKLRKQRKSTPTSTPKTLGWLSDKGLFFGSLILFGGALLFLFSIAGKQVSMNKNHAESPLPSIQNRLQPLEFDPSNDKANSEQYTEKKEAKEKIKPNELNQQQTQTSSPIDLTEMEKLYRKLIEKTSAGELELETTLDNSDSALTLFEKMISLEPEHKLVEPARQAILSAYIKKSRLFKTQKNSVQANLYIEKAIDIQAFKNNH